MVSLTLTLLALSLLVLAPLGVMSGVAAARFRRRALTAQASQDAPPQPIEASAPGLPTILRLGQEAVDAGDYARALTWFDTALQLDPQAAQVHLCRGLCLAKLERADEAASAFEAAAGIDPADTVAAFHLARAHGVLGSERDALRALEPLLEAVPGLAEQVWEDPAFERLHDHPRFLQLTGRL